mmetsp:Transcript_1942/g.5765  ORF Transcript_1942/g.5765 Transcript_1942/m.5765 type:complete len:238 (+) Transcript_1942:1240-1953(+)
MQLDFNHWPLRLAGTDFNQVLLARVPIRPESIPVDEHLCVLGVVALGQEVLELRGLGGNVVDHEFELQVHIFGKALHVLPAAKLLIHLLVGQGRKAAVAGRGVDGQQMQPVHHPPEVLIHESPQLRQPTVNCIGVRAQLHLVSQAGLLRLLLYKGIMVGEGALFLGADVVRIKVHSAQGGLRAFVQVGLHDVVVVVQRVQHRLQWMVRHRPLRRLVHLLSARPLLCCRAHVPPESPL